MRRVLLAFVLLACAAGCASSASGTTAVRSGPSAAQAPLIATVTISGKNASVELVNRSTSPVSIPSQTLDSAQLLLEVRDAGDHAVATMPPPTPTTASRTLLAGERLTVTLSLDVFSPALASGRYTVRARGADIESNVATYMVP